MLSLDSTFIPEELWEKNQHHAKQQRVLWAQVYDEVREFYELEILAQEKNNDSEYN